jgi:nitrate reductase (cytochrome), electron transfer subunit
MSSEIQFSWRWILAVVVISFAVVGYFVGLQAPMNPAHRDFETRGLTPPRDPAVGDFQIQAGVVPATSYLQMAEMTQARLRQQRSSLNDLKSAMDPYAEIEVTETDKRFALASRQLNRAFNGAPPTVPHPIDQLSSQSCLVCHGEGFVTSTLRASKMSHQFLENCTQCHVEQNAKHLPSAEFKESTFVGLPAPFEGHRAYPGAPPTIPHSTWMRVDCLSCHGVNSIYGIRTTHPWRDSCLQCHAPSAELDQVKLPSNPQFLPPIPLSGETD